MSETALVSSSGVGASLSAAKTCPVISGAVQLVPTRVSGKPVMELAAAGLIPRSPVTSEGGTLVMPDWARMTYVAASPSATAPGPIAPEADGGLPVEPADGGADSGATPDCPPLPAVGSPL